MKLRVSESQIKKILVASGIMLGCVLLYKTVALWEARYGMANVTLHDQHEAAAAEKEREAVFYDGQWYALRENLETVLLIGVDTQEPHIAKDDNNNNMLADFLMLFVLDHEAGSYSALHINRDTMADIPVSGEHGKQAGFINGQLALSYAFGSGGADSCKTAVKAVSNFLFGMEIDHYIALTMSAVPVINDMAGGVSLMLLDDFTTYDEAMKKDMEVNLTGDMALAYVSHRKELDDTTNINRMARQRQYLTALKDCAASSMENDDEFVLKSIGVLMEYMVSDYTANQLSVICEEIISYKDEGLTEIAGEALKGDEYMEFYADEELLMKTLIDLFYEPYQESEG